MLGSEALRLEEGATRDRAAAERMAVERAVVGPEEVLLSSDALGLRRDADPLEVRVRQRVGAIEDAADLEAARGGGHRRRVEPEVRRLVAAGVVALGPEVTDLAVVREV